MAGAPLSLLSGEEIAAALLVSNDVAVLYRASTYDLTIGDIIPVGSEAEFPAGTRQFSLPSGGTVRVVSAESLNLPKDITGHVLLKNALCAAGVLAINIGVVDPLFEGPISSTLINFGRTEYTVTVGEPFLRVSFHRCPQSAKARPVKFDRLGYIKQVRTEVKAYSAPTFLNVKQIAAEAAEKAFGSFQQWLLAGAAVAAVVLALATIFAPLGASYVDKFLQQRDRER